MTILKRALNEAPTLAVIVVTILGLSESDAVVWKEAVASLSALGTWFLVRYSTDGPVTVVRRERRIREAIRRVRDIPPPSRPIANPEPLTDSDTEVREQAVDFLCDQGYAPKVAFSAVEKFLNGEELTPQEANCITQVRQSGIRLPKVS